MNARLFVHHRTPPEFNMAFDEWMLSAASQSPGALLLRLYTWEPGSLTFGFNQRQATALDFSRTGETPVIRRITGGRAVYHDVSELTYAVAYNSLIPPVPQLAGSTGQSSETIARVLSRFLAAMGINASWVRNSSTQNARPDFFHRAACFASHAKYELTAEGAKIVASARRDWDGGVLQHGSIKVNGVASHPALCHQPAEAGGALKSVARPELNSYAESFAAVVKAELGVTATDALLSDFENRALFERTEYVRGCPLAKREIIAHSVRAESP
jgi:lipoate-protein ligase A